MRLSDGAGDCHAGFLDKVREYSLFRCAKWLGIFISNIDDLEVRMIRRGLFSAS